MMVKTTNHVLTDEEENPGKGADCVITLVHRYLEHHGAGEKDVYLHADNCVGQNKNDNNSISRVESNNWKT